MAVRGGGSAVEPTCFEKDEGTGAWGADPPVSPQSQAQKFDHARRQRSDHVAAADNQCVEIRIAERLRRDADADRAADGPAGLGQQAHVVDWLVHLLIREFEHRERGKAHHLKAGQDDDTDMLHKASSDSVLKRRFYYN